ncbi:MAG: hypothetical protein ABI267_01640, partial [Ginsengibacter sp.]
GVFIFFFILTLSLKAQNPGEITSYHSAEKNIFIKTPSFFPAYCKSDATIYFKKFLLPASSETKQTTKNLSPFNLQQIIPSNFSTCTYGFFCRQELKIEKATNIPIRVRLGSLAQCNYYEGKP